MAHFTNFPKEKQKSTYDHIAIWLQTEKWLIEIEHFRNKLSERYFALVVSKNRIKKMQTLEIMENENGFAFVLNHPNSHKHTYTNRHIEFTCHRVNVLNVYIYRCAIWVSANRSYLNTSTIEEVPNRISAINACVCVCVFEYVCASDS